MSFWGELKRRNVFKVGAAYLIAAWLIAQVVSITFPAFHMPGWTVTFVIFLLIIGFFVAIILAWAYEVTPDGVKLTKKVPLADSITHVTGRKLNYVLAGLLVIAVLYIGILKFYPDKAPVQTEAASNVTEQTPDAVDFKEAPKTIAVLPFDDLSPEKDQEYFVLGLSEEILNSLAQIEDLTVIAKTSSFSFKGGNKTIQEIADVLGVENILEGSVRKAGNTLRITAQLVKAVDGSHLWSKTYDKEFKVEDIFSVQEDIATSVADELKVTLGIGKSFKQRGGTENLKAYELYLNAIGQDDNSRALESINAAIAIDPDFALAWAVKAILHLRLSSSVVPDLATKMQDAALHATQKANELEPNLAEAYVMLGTIKRGKKEWIEAELAYRKSLELETKPWSLYAEIVLHYYSVGDFKKALELSKELQRNDPLNKLIRGSYIYILGLLNDTQQAEKEYEQDTVLFGDQWPMGDSFISFIRLGHGNVSRNEIPEIPNFDPIWGIARDNIESPEDGLKELRRIYTTNDNLSVDSLTFISIWAAYFGDPELSMDAMEELIGIDASRVSDIWFPVMHEVRQLSRFKKFVREIGLVDYWEQFGWPDICRPLDDGDFVCD